MGRPLLIAVAALLAFAAILIARAPASWLIPSGPGAPFSCMTLEGTVWDAACTGLTVARQSYGDLTWELHPGALLRARLGAHVTLTRGAAHGSGDLELGFDQRIVARDLSADLPLDPQLLPGVPRELHGTVHAQLALVGLTRGALTQLQGRIEAHDLEDRGGNVTPLGSYVVTFPGNEGEPQGTLKDLGGPLAVEGTLRLTRAGGYDLEAFITPRPGAAPELVSNLKFLGSPDASGRRQFSMSGTF